MPRQKKQAKVKSGSSQSKKRKNFPSEIAINKKKTIRNNNRPKINEYFGEEARAYGHSKWMKRNQIKTAMRALELLESKHIFPNGCPVLHYGIVLDLGSGTGYTSSVLTSHGYRSIAIDLSRDMLNMQQLDVKNYRIQADMRFLPIRLHTFSAIISISAFNFISEGGKNEDEMRDLIDRGITQLEYTIKPNCRTIIEYYPTDVERKLILERFRQGSWNGGQVIDNRGTRHQKEFLVMEYRKN